MGKNLKMNPGLGVWVDSEKAAVECLGKCFVAIITTGAKKDLAR